MDSISVKLDRRTSRMQYKGRRKHGDVGAGPHHFFGNKLDLFQLGLVPFKFFDILAPLGITCTVCLYALSRFY